jgi:hypothetical protein
MLIVKLEKEGGAWEYEEFDDVMQIAKHIKKNPDLKVRLIASTNNKLKSDLEEAIFILDQ